MLELTLEGEFLCFENAMTSQSVLHELSDALSAFCRIMPVAFEFVILERPNIGHVLVKNSANTLNLASYKEPLVKGRSFNSKFLCNSQGKPLNFFLIPFSKKRMERESVSSMLKRVLEVS